MLCPPLEDRRKPKMNGIRWLKEVASPEIVPRMEVLLGTRASQQKEKIHFEMHGKTFGISPSPDDQTAGGNHYESA